MAEFLASLPIEAVLVEGEGDRGQDLREFSHPKRAVYLFGGEDRTLPVTGFTRATAVHIETTHCLNLAVTASIVMYDRTVKGKGETT